MRAMVLGMGLAVLGAPALGQALWQEGCFVREYDAAHLAAHPRQQVTRIAIRLSGGSPQVDGAATMDIFARVRPIAGHSLFATVKDGASDMTRLNCFVEQPGTLGARPKAVTSCGYPNACSADEWVRLTELSADHAVIEDGSYGGAGSVAVPIGDSSGVYIGEEVECDMDDAACNAANASVKYRMQRADPQVCAAIFDRVQPAKGCGG